MFQLSLIIRLILILVLTLLLIQILTPIDKQLFIRFPLKSDTFIKRGSIAEDLLVILHRCELIYKLKTCFVYHDKSKQILDYIFVNVYNIFLYNYYDAFVKLNKSDSVSQIIDIKSNLNVDEYVAILLQKKKRFKN